LFFFSLTIHLLATFLITLRNVALPPHLSLL
jgi:hypothetical protein